MGAWLGVAGLSWAAPHLSQVTCTCFVCKSSSCMKISGLTPTCRLSSGTPFELSPQLMSLSLSLLRGSGTSPSASCWCGMTTAPAHEA